MARAPVLMLPGFGGSGPGHWQTIWEEEDPFARRVQQRDWDRPVLSEWLTVLQREVECCPQPPILVAHSLACATVAHFAAREAPPLAGALLVSPADVEIIAEWYPELAGFSPMPAAALAFPAIVVASTDDPYVTVERAAELATAWGADLEILEGAGHINLDSGHGPWPEGRAYLARLGARAA